MCLSAFDAIGLITLPHLTLAGYGIPRGIKFRRGHRAHRHAWGHAGSSWHSHVGPWIFPSYQGSVQICRWGFALDIAHSRIMMCHSRSVCRLHWGGGGQTGITTRSLLSIRGISYAFRISQLWHWRSDAEKTYHCIFFWNFRFWLWRGPLCPWQCTPL